MRTPDQLFYSQITGQLIEDPIVFMGQIYSERDVLKTAHIMSLIDEKEEPQLVDFICGANATDKQIPVLMAAGYLLFRGDEKTLISTISPGEEKEILLRKPSQIIAKNKVPGGAHSEQADPNYQQAFNKLVTNIEAFVSSVKRFNTRKETIIAYFKPDHAFPRWKDLENLIKIKHHQKGLPLPSVSRQTAVTALRSSSALERTSSDEKSSSPRSPRASRVVFMQPKEELSQRDETIIIALKILLNAEIPISIESGKINIHVTTPKDEKSANELIDYFRKLNILYFSEKSSSPRINLDNLLKEGEEARKFLLTMRKLLRNRDVFPNLTKIMKEQQEIVSKIKILEFPLIDENGIPSAGAYQSAAELLKKLREIQELSLNQFHGDLKLNQWYNTLRYDTESASVSSLVQKANALIPIDDRAKSLKTLIANGEKARVLLKTIYDQSSIKPVGSYFRKEWPDHIRAQRRLIENLGALSETSVLEQVFAYDDSNPNANKIAAERSQWLIDTLEDVYEQSRSALNSHSFRTKATKKWHEVICTDVTKSFLDSGGVRTFVDRFNEYAPSSKKTEAEIKAEADQKHEDPEIITREDYTRLMTCALTGKPAKHPTIFDGKVYDKHVLVNVLIDTKNQYSDALPPPPQNTNLADDFVAGQYYQQKLPIIFNPSNDEKDDSVKLDNVDLIKEFLNVGMMAAPAEVFHFFCGKDNFRILIQNNPDRTLDGKKISHKEYIAHIESGLTYLKERKTIHEFVFAKLDNEACNFSVCGLDCEALVNEANEALKVLAAFYRLASKEHPNNFKRRGRRLDPNSDAKHLPTGILKQFLAISLDGEIHQLIKENRMIPQTDNAPKTAFKVLRVMREVTQTAQKSQKEWSVARHSSTKAWYGLFNSESETRFEATDHKPYKVQHPEGYFTDLQRKIGLWAKENNAVGLEEKVVADEKHQNGTGAEITPT